MVESTVWNVSGSFKQTVKPSYLIQTGRKIVGKEDANKLLLNAPKIVALDV